MYGLEIRSVSNCVTQISRSVSPDGRFVGLIIEIPAPHSTWRSRVLRIKCLSRLSEILRGACFKAW